MKRCVLYLRVSTAEQVEGTSLETQERLSREYAARNSMEVAGVFTDRGESAKTTDRPEFQRMIRFATEAKNKVSFVLVYRLDRLARNTYDHQVYSATLAKYGVSIRSATEPLSDDPTGKFVTTMLSAMAELDNSIRGQRAKDGMQRVAEKGGWVFQAPWGYVVGRDAEGLPILTEHPQQGPLIRQMFEMAASGLQRLTDIRKAMARQGWKQVFGTQIHLQTVQKVLTNPIHCGRLTGRLLGGKTIKARFKTLVDEQTFDRVQLVLAGKGHIATPHAVNNEAFPLRMFVKCGACGCPLTASFSRGGSGGRYPYYRCRDKNCLTVHVKKTTLEDAFRLHLQNNVTEVSAARLQFFRNQVVELWQGRHAAALAEKAAQRRRVEELEGQQRRLLDKLVKGVINDEAYQAKSAELSAEQALARVQAHDSELEELDIEGVLNCAEYMFRNTAAIWDKLDLDNRQRFQRVLFPSGLTYSMTGGFGTCASSPIINVLQQESDGKSTVARPRRVELRFQG